MTETTEKKPDAEKPDAEKPDAEKPDAEKPDAEKPRAEKSKRASKTAAPRQVRMKTTQAGPSGVRESGRVYPIPEAEAAGLVKGGFGEYADDKTGSVEKATREAPENAAKRTGK